MEKIQDILASSLNQPAVIKMGEELSEGIFKPSEHKIDLSQEISGQSIHVLDSFKEGGYLLDISQNKPANESVNEKKPLMKIIYHAVESGRNLKQSFQKHNLLIMAMIALTLLFTLNLINIYYRALEKKEETISLAYEGFQRVIEGGADVFQADLLGASESFDKALYNFKVASDGLWLRDDSSFGVLHSGAGSKTAQSLLESGKLIAEAGTSFTQAILILQQELAGFQTSGQRSPESSSITDALKLRFFPLLDITLNKAEEASKELQDVPQGAIPQVHRDQFVKARIQVHNFIEYAKSLKRYTPTVLKFLGDRYPKRYLVMLTNTNEPRPALGFFGNYILFDINDGHFENLSVHDVYASDGLLHEEISAPEDFQALTKGWRMRDSNYSPHFPISAAKVDWFLQKEKGPSVDSVIALDLEFTRKLLELTGPLALDRFEKPITSENFVTLFQYVIESKIDGVSDPKQIMKEVVPRMVEELAKTKKWPQIISMLSEAISTKHLMAYSKDDDIQAFFRYVGADGSMITPKAGEDYLQVVYTSVGGNKSFAWIEETIEHQTSIDSDGSLTNQVTITQQHTWNAEKERDLRRLVSAFGISSALSDSVIDILGRSSSKVMARVYVPQGSVLEMVNGVFPASVKTLVDDEVGLTYFMVPMTVAPGKTLSVSMRYQLPFRLKVDATPLFRLGSDVIDTYSIKVQKRAGSENVIFKKEVIVDPLLRGYKSFPHSFEEAGEGVYREEGMLKNDRDFSIVVGIP